MLEHIIRLHTRKTICLICHCIFYVLPPRTVYIKLSNFILFSLENDEMESSKPCVQFFSLVFIIRYFYRNFISAPDVILFLSFLRLLQLLSLVCSPQLWSGGGEEQNFRPNWHLIPDLTHPLHKKDSYSAVITLLFSNTAWVLLRRTELSTFKEVWDRTSGLSSLSEKTRKSNHLQMKGSTFSSVIYRPWVLVRSEYRTRNLLRCTELCAQPNEPPVRSTATITVTNVTANALFLLAVIKGPKGLGS